VDPGGERDGGVWTSERVYRALIRLYPEEVRRRYAEEMVRYFGDLCREEWHGRGTKGMVSLWSRTLPDLLFSVLKERGTNFLRSACLPMAPGTAARWGALSALLGGSLGAAFILAYTVTISAQLYWLSDAAIYPAIPIFATLLSFLGTFGLYGTLVARSGRPDALALSGATLAALAVVSFLALYASYTTAAMLGWLWTPGEGIAWWEMHRTMLLQYVGMGAYALGLLLLGVCAFRAHLFGRLRALPLAVAPLWPASIGLFPLLNRSGMGYLGELGGALPFFGAALLGWVMLNYHPTERPAAAGGDLGSVSDTFDRQGEYDLAVEAYQQVIALGHPEAAPRAAFNLGMLFEERGEYDRAVEAYRRAIASGHIEWAPKAAFDLGILFENRREYDLADEAYRRAIASMHPEEAPRAAFNLGLLLDKQGEYDLAVEAYQQAIESKHAEWAPKAMFNLAMLFEERGKYGRAEEAYQQAIDSDHSDAASKARLNLGVLFEQMGE
jgi:tetratricopeptide (TPR) repeat protein